MKTNSAADFCLASSSTVLYWYYAIGPTTPCLEALIQTTRGAHVIRSFSIYTRCRIRLIIPATIIQTRSRMPSCEISDVLVSFYSCARADWTLHMIPLARDAYFMHSMHPANSWSFASTVLELNPLILHQAL